MKGKIIRGLLAVALATSVTIGNLGASMAMAQNDNSVSGSTIDELLKKMPENYKSYLEVTTGSKIKIDKAIDLTSDTAIKIIVEFNSEPVVIQNTLENARAIKLTEEDLLTEHEEFKKSFEKNMKSSQEDSESSKIEFGYEYTQVFNGIAMTIPASQVENIAAMDGIKAIWENKEYEIEPPVEEEKSYFTMDGITPYMDDSIPGIGVDKLHEEEIKGEGIKVGVLDTGVDYNHPDLKEAFKGGYDFIDNDEDPMEATYEEWKNSGYPEFSYNGNSYYTAHGTHVAGTILGRGANEGVDVAITGVAPKAELYAYRVLGPYGTGSDEGILAAIDRAVEDGMDVINLSLGSDINNGLSPDAIAINNCMLYTDTVAVVAAGNAGPNAYTVGSPGTAALGITVGANTSETKIDTIEMSYMDEKYSLMAFAKNWTDKVEDLLLWSLPIEFAGLGSEEDFKDRDFTGKIALIERGDFALVEKIANAKAAGAQCAIIYNNVEGDMAIYLGEDSSYITTLSMSKEKGEKLKAAVISEGASDKVVTFENAGQVSSEGNILADFSSRGPVSNSYDIKPEITAPGYNILSTVPGYINDKEGEFDYSISYSRMSGTSMATPHVAGLVALILETHPEYKPADVKTILMNTAEDLNGDYSVFEVGAGRINGYEAVKSKINIQVKDETDSIDQDGENTKIPDVTGDLSFGRREKGILNEKNFTVINNGREEKNFIVETYFSKSNSTPMENPEDHGVSIKVPGSIKVSPGEENQAKFEITVPETAESGIYEGYVVLRNADNSNEDYRLPFAINVSDTYINVEALIDIFSLGEFHPYQSAPYTYFGFEVSDRFDNLDVLVKDGETNEYIGYIGSLRTDLLPTNSYIEVGPLIGYGYYCPILKNNKDVYYIDPTATKLSEDKRYVIEFRGATNKGEIIAGADDYFVDSKPPIISMNEDSKPGIFEVQYHENNPEEVLWLNGHVYDEYVEYATSYDYDISQRDNMLVYLEKINGKNKQGRLALGEDGKINIGYPTKEINEVGVARLSIYPVDKAASGDYRTGLENYAFIKKGMPYISMTGENRNLKIGDTVTVSMAGKYLSDFAFGTFEAMIPILESGEGVYEIKSIKPTEELEQFLRDNNMELDIEMEETIISFGQAFYPIKCELKGDNIVGINGDMALLDFEVEVLNENVDAMAQIVMLGARKGYSILESFQFTNTKGETQKIEVLNTSKGVINSGKTSGLGIVVPQGASDEYYNMVQNLSDMGTDIVVIAPDGTKYSALLDYENMGYFKVEDIPAMKGNYKIHVDTPGHLSATQEARFSFEYGDKIYGNSLILFQINQFGGDVNGDGVIDIRDAIIIARAIGNQVPEVNGISRDINNDKVIDQVDLNYVVENFALVNGLQEGVDMVLSDFDGMNLEDVLAKAGAMYETVAPEININLEDGKVYNSQVNLEVTSTDYVYSTHVVYVNGEQFEGSSLYEEGKYEIKVVAMDDLGNTAEKTVNIAIKTQGPKVVIEGVEDGKIYEGPVKPIIILEEETENIITLNDLPYAGEEISEEGKYTLKVISKDLAENITEVSVNFEIIKKPIDPEPEKPNPEEPEKPNPEEPGKPTPEEPRNPDKDGNNKPGVNLPQTGAIVGSTLLSLVGIVVVGAGIFGIVVMNKKRKEEKESKEKKEEKEE